MILAGVVAGYTGYLWRDRDADDEAVGPAKFILLSLLAAATTPLFLQTISSELLANCKKNPENYFIFEGLCLLAGFSAPQYLKRMTSKIFDDVAKTKAEIPKLRSAIQAERDQLESQRNLIESRIADDDIEPEVGTADSDVGK